MTERPPLSTSTRIAAGACLVVGGLLVGVCANAGYVLSGGIDDPEAKLRWGVEHSTYFRVEQIGTWLSTILLLVGFLGIAGVTRWSHPRLTAVAVPLLVAGMWGFSNSEALWYTVGSVAPPTLGIEQAVKLNDAFASDPGVVSLVLIPLLAGQFFGFILLAAAGWRDFPKPALGLIVAYLLWEVFLSDSVGGGVGPIAAESLFLVGAVWLGISLLTRDWPSSSSDSGPVAARRA